MEVKPAPESKGFSIGEAIAMGIGAVVLSVLISYNVGWENGRKIGVSDTRWAMGDHGECPYGTVLSVGQICLRQGQKVTLEP